MGNVEMAMHSESVYHITTHKCGSQWVRDILTSPEIHSVSGLIHASTAPRLDQGLMPDEENGYLYSPVYDLNALEWRGIRKNVGKGIVVLRDPRDVIVSLLYSHLYSHASSPRVDFYRRQLFDLPDLGSRLKLLFRDNFYKIRFFLSWSNYTSNDVYVVRYEDLIQNQQEVFGNIFEWLGWSLPLETVIAVIERHSFKRRSGRSPGETDLVSHFRRGLAGDWKNHFTRDLGELWEGLYPGFLAKVGYETRDDWWCHLPEEISSTPENSLSREQEELEAQRRRIHVLEAQINEKEGVIQELASVCAERLALIEQLDIALKERKPAE